MQKKLSFPLLFNETCKFISSKLWQIIVITCIIGILSTIISLFFLFQSISDIVQEILMSSSNGYTFLNFVKLVLLLMLINITCQSINISAVYSLSSSSKLERNSLVSNTLSNFLKLLKFNLIYMLLALFVVIILTLFSFLFKLFPENLASGITIIFTLAIVFYVQIVYSFFIGSITAPNSKGFFQIFKETHYLIKRYWINGFIIIAAYFLCIILLNILSNNVKYFEYLQPPITNFLNIFLIYFFYLISIQLSKEQSVSENSDATNNKLLV